MAGPSLAGGDGGSEWVMAVTPGGGCHWLSRERLWLWLLTVATRKTIVVVALITMALAGGAAAPGADGGAHAGDQWRSPFSACCSSGFLALVAP
jgi:hypothetical protein